MQIYIDCCVKDYNQGFIKGLKMVEVILDTNFATIPFDFKVDIYAEIERIIDEPYRIVFPKICLNELRKLKNGKAASELMEKKNVQLIDIPIKKNVDESIIEHAKGTNGIIATQDKELKKKALKKGLTVITLRKKQFLIKLGGL